jgi:hypothetical protein
MAECVVLEAVLSPVECRVDAGAASILREDATPNDAAVEALHEVPEAFSSPVECRIDAAAASILRGETIPYVHPVECRVDAAVASILREEAIPNEAAVEALHGVLEAFSSAVECRVDAAVASILREEAAECRVDAAAEGVPEATSYPVECRVDAAVASIVREAIPSRDAEAEHEIAANWNRLLLRAMNLYDMETVWEVSHIMSTNGIEMGREVARCLWGWAQCYHNLLVLLDDPVWEAFADDCAVHYCLYGCSAPDMTANSLTAMPRTVKGSMHTMVTACARRRSLQACFTAWKAQMQRRHKGWENYYGSLAEALRHVCYEGCSAHGTPERYYETCWRV